MNTKNNSFQEEKTVYPIFTADMKDTHTILIPQMAPLHFYILAKVFEQEGYHTELLQNNGPQVIEEGLKYIHNDICYPALLVVGQFIDALKSGKYDVDKTALIITQTGGGCRASNYIHLLRKALVKANFNQVPVISLNFSGLETGSAFKYTIPMLRKALATVFYGDLLLNLSNQIQPYENSKGETVALVRYWQDKIVDNFSQGKSYSKKDMKETFNAIAFDFSRVPITKIPKVQVGIVGEIYVKFSPLGNNHLEDFLLKENCEVNMPGLMSFIQYCVVNGVETIKLYGGSSTVKKAFQIALEFIETREKIMYDAIRRHTIFKPPVLFREVYQGVDGFIGYGAKMGEGWLLTAEMIELVKSGCENIVCAQPFGCLPNHIVGKAMISKIRSVYPQANITPIDYDPSATKVNQENRIKLMLAVAKERIENKAV